MPIKVERITQVSSLGARGEIIPMYVVEFMIDDDGPFTRQFPTTGFSKDEAAKMIEADAKEIQELKKWER